MRCLCAGGVLDSATFSRGFFRASPSRTPPRMPASPNSPDSPDARVDIVWDPPWTQTMISEDGKMQLGLI